MPGEIKKVANGGKTPVLAPIVLKPIQVQVPLRRVLIEVRDVPIAEIVLPDRAVLYK